MLTVGPGPFQTRTTLSSPESSDRVPILVVDDQPMNLDAIDAVLGETGCRLVRAQSPDEALLALLEQDFAAIVLDIKMPGMNGIDLADLIKARPRSRHVPILFLTAHVFNEREVLRGYGAGAVDYLTKPIHAEILRSKIAVFVELFRKTQELARTNEALRLEALERARAEEALRVANQDLEARVKERTEALERADRRKDEFLAVLGHELRNPLAPILSALEVMQPNVPETQRKEARAIVGRQTRQMARLIDDLLDVGRITSDTFALRTAPVTLESVVSSAVETSRPVLNERHHALAVQLPETEVRLIADAVRLSQVLANLLTNSAKYTPVGGAIHVSADATADGVTIRVRDNGVGIDPAMLPAIFDLFVRGDHPAGAGSGLGIGLALARRLVEMHGGELIAASEGRDRGSEFLVRLPAAVLIPAAPALTNDATPGPAGRSLRVLVVDDNTDAADMFVMMLGLWGHSARPAYTGLSALRLAEEMRPDVVLLDLGLPDIEGHEVASRLQHQEWARGAAIYAVTGRGLDIDRERSAAAGFRDHLIKPVPPDTLKQLLAALAGA